MEDLIAGIAIVYVIVYIIIYNSYVYIIIQIKATITNCNEICMSLGGNAYAHMY